MRDPPETRREETSYELHGDAVDDPYLWLEDDTDAVSAWVDAQNDYADAHLESIDARERLRPEFERFARTTTYGTVVARPTGYFQTVETADDDHAVLYHRARLADEREVLVDPNEFSEDGTVSMGWWTVAPDGERLAYGVDESGAEQYDVRVVDVATGDRLEELPDVGRCSPMSFSWTPDGFYYQSTGGAGDGQQLRKTVRFHAFGTDPATDDRLYEVEEPSTWPVLAGGRDGEHLLVALVTGWERSDLVYKATDDDEFTEVITDADHFYLPTISGDRAYLRTDHEAPYYRVAALDLPATAGDIAPESLESVVLERDGILTDVSIAGDRLLAQYEREAVAELEVFALDGSHEATVPLPGLGALSGLSGNRDAPEAFFSYQSFDQPPTVFRYDVAVGEREELDRLDVSVDVPLSVEHVRYESADGTGIPAFVVHREGLDRDGDNPALLSGYGGFEVSQTPAFLEWALPFLRAGGVYAIANLRGGGEFGTEWHEAARGEHKQRTFDDFVAAAEYLIEAGYTTSDRLAIAGGSNGGLTVGAAMTQRPDLFRAVLCTVPLLDMLRFHRFLLGESWTSEYGSPDDPEAAEWLREYSPYHSVTDRAYPAVLFKTAESDTRVHPVHAWKMAARLRNRTTGDRPILCKTDRDTGHGTGKPTWMVVEEKLDKWSFVFDQLGVEYVEP